MKKFLPANSDAAECFAPASQNYQLNLPIKQLSCSSSIGWTSLLVQNYQSFPKADSFETSPTADHTIVIATKGECDIESFSNRSWNKAVYRAGLGGMTAAGCSNRLRWQSRRATPHENIHLFIPPYYFAAAADEFRRVGTSSRLEQPDTLSFDDPIVAQMAFSLHEAVLACAPNLYAETAAQFLATHLLPLHSRWSEPSTGIRKAGEISDRRLERVLEFMTHHFRENLTIAELSREAGISRFHFMNLFKKKCGITPHQHLIQLRMNRAASLLLKTDLTIKEIGVQCGYENPAYLPAAFRKHFGQTPTNFRRKSKI